FCRSDRGPRGENNIDLESDELGRDLGKAFGAPVRPANLNCDVSALGPVEFTQPLHKSGGPWAPGRSRGPAQEPDGFHLCWLLRASCERPCGRAAEQSDELAAVHSITSSTVICMIIGTVRPSAFAVLRLMIRSSFTACWTGRSAGFSPLRMRPV